jgi:hypothetical protein
MLGHTHFVTPISVGSGLRRAIMGHDWGLKQAPLRGIYWKWKGAWVTSFPFDSIPSDLGVLLLHEAVTADGAGAGQLEDTTLVVRAMKGGPSDGTIARMKGR